jgi:hypothetical protein
VHQNPEPRTADREPDRSSTYARVIVLEAAIILALWFFGRMFS